MKVLLDTHAVIWFLLGDKHLSAKARGAIEDTSNEAFVSAVAAYEIALKQRRGLVPVFGNDLAYAVTRVGMRAMPITVGHAERAGNLPGPHRDPWDRVLMAQAELEDCTVLTVDKVFDDYGIRTLW